MRKQIVTAVATAAVVMLLVGNAPAQDVRATIRTYQGVSYKVADPSLEVFYTIGDLKEKKEEPKFASTISITTSATAATGGGEQAGGAEKGEKHLRGHSRASAITVSREGVETRIALDQVRSLLFTRRPVAVGGLQLPPYIPYYRYSVSVNLVSGEKVEADHVTLGATIVRGTSPSGRVDIPWEEVESIAFDR